MSITITNQRLWIAVVTLLAAVVLFPHRAHAASVTVNLCATSGSITVPANPAPISVPIWGYVTGDCTVTTTAGAPGGPVVVVNQGDVVTVTLRNNLSEPTGLLFQGQAIRPDLTGTPGSTTKSYVFTASQAGTYLYEAALLPNAQHQVAMGLYGALIVRPTSAPDVVIPGQAYITATTAYTNEAVLVLSEIDPALNANPAGFDLRNYKPRYWLINGQIYSNTALDIATAAGNRVLLRYVNAGLQHHSMTVLGLNQVVIATDGSLLTNAHTMVAETIAPGQTLDAITTVPPAAAAGSKFALYDANLILHNNNTAGFGGMLTFLAIAPGTPGPDTVGPATSNVALTPNPTNGTVPVALSASISDASTGGATVTAAEYFIDAIGANGAGCPITSGLGSVTANVSASIPISGASTPCTDLAALASGNHTIYVHGKDNVGIGNWGATNFAVLNLDKTGPTTSGLALSVNPSNGTVNVTLTGTANDSATGNTNIAGAEYFIGAPLSNGAGTTLTLNTTASPVASLNVTIAAATINALAHGSYVVNVHSRDAFGNWGAFAQISLKVDKLAPTISGSVTANPNPTNGLVSGNPAQPAVQLDATFVDAAVVAAAGADSAAENPSGSTSPDSTNSGSDTDLSVHVYMPMVMGDPANNDVAMTAVVPGTSYVQKAEAFVFTINDHVPTVAEYGTGFQFTANDGLFDGITETARALIPLATVLQLSDGNHTVYMHGLDGAGNWGALTTLNLVVDKAAPTFTGITLTPSSFIVGSTATVVLTVTTASDNGGTGITGGEYWFGTTDPAPGAGTAFTGVTTNIPVGSLAVGTYTVRARLRDALGNWSVAPNGIGSATLTVTPPPFYFSTFGNSNPPGVGGTADDADIYFWNGTAFSRVVDVTTIANPVPGGANVDGLVRVDNTHFYLSFSGDVVLPGLGTNVQDEDIAFYNAGTWSVYFDGTAPGRLGGVANLDIDAFDIVGSTLYFSTVGNTNPPGVAGGADDADIYAWNGTAFSRVFDASANGLAGSANVDGLSMTDATHFYMSFSDNTTVTGPGAVQDEDVVRYNAGVWSVYIDGTAIGLISGNLDPDAIDVP